jgi:hypothetical protein
MAKKTRGGSGEKSTEAKKEKVARIGNTLEIKAYMHCGLCLSEKPDNVSAASFSRLDVGWTQWGLQVWCRRHECNVCNIDFEGQQHQANTTRPRKPS